jgi:PKD repeat protein
MQKKNDWIKKFSILIKVSLIFLAFYAFSHQQYIGAAEAEIIKDNSDPGFQFVGSWPASTFAPGYYLSDYRHNDAGVGDDQATWSFAVPKAGTYKVYSWWTSGNARSPNAPFTINHAFGTTTVRVDQRSNGGQWNEIGEVYFEEGNYSITLTEDADGYVIADAVKIAFQNDNIPPPQADFGADLVVGLAPLDVQFSDKSIGYISEWNWDFGDGTSSNDQNPTHTYVQDGDYTVQLTVAGDSGSDSEIKEFFVKVARDTIIIDNAKAEYVGGWPTSLSVLGYYGDYYQYNQSGVGNDKAIWKLNINKAGTYRLYAWWTAHSNRASNAPYLIEHAFGTTEIRKNQRIDGIRWNELGEFYFDAGQYDIILTDQADGYVIADAMRFTFLYSEILPCEADFTSDVSSGGPPLQVHFNDRSTGNINRWEWNFGDGTTSNEQNPTHTYDKYGVYSVSLTVYDDDGNDIEHKQDYMIVSDVKIIKDNSDPGFQFVGSWPASTFAPGYYLSDYRHNDAGVGDDQATWSFAVPKAGTYKVYSWWTSGNARSPNAPFTINHAFGTTTVLVDQRSNGGQWNEIGEVYFEEGNCSVVLKDDADGVVIADAIRIIFVGDQIPVDFYANQRFGLSPLRVNFSALDNGEIAEWFWDFGDGSSSNDMNPTHTYTEPGSYTVTLMRTDSQGSRSKTKSEFITASDIEILKDNLDPDFQTLGWWPKSIGVPEFYSTNYQYNRAGVGNDWAAWNFAIPRAGVYKVFGWWTSASDRSPNAPFTINHAFGATTVRVDQRTNGSRWYEIGAAYFEEGNGSVVLTDNADGYVIADAVRLLFITEDPPPPIADFDISIQAEQTSLARYIGEATTIQFTDKTSGLIDGWYWDFGDGQVSNEQNPQHTYLYPGVYSVSLTVVDISNQSNTFTRENAIVVTEANNTESIFIFSGYSRSSGKSVKNFIERMLEEIGAFRADNRWIYWNQINDRISFIEFIYGPAGYTKWTEALQLENAHLIYIGHANYGAGHVFANSDDEIRSQAIYDARSVDDDRFLNFQSKYFSLPIDYFINSQAFPDFQPIFNDGVSAVMPYKFNDPEFFGDPDNPGIPPFNYYITYQLPGEPTHYKIETNNNGALERFIGSNKAAWYSADGEQPDPANPDHLKYFITKPYGTGVRAHYSDRTILYRRDLEIPKEAYNYSRMFLFTCNSGFYYSETYNHGILFYTLGDVASITTVNIYLKYYLLGMSDQEIYEAIQAVDNVFDYHNFDEPPPVTPPSFALQWDIFIDEINDNVDDPDRTGLTMIGTDSGSSYGPNGTDTDRFLVLAFYKNGGGGSGTVDLVARSRHDSWSSWTTVASGLDMDRWYTIKVVCDLIHDTVDIFVDGILFADDLESRMLKDVVTHITFAQLNNVAGTFYVDNVQTVIPESEILADGNFEASFDSLELRDNDTDQDWFESFSDFEEVITLNQENIGGNSTKKIRFGGSTPGGAFLSQEFNPSQTK